jgi:hypothetical protein
MNRDKWIESEKAHRDLGKDENGNYTDSFRTDWISKNGKKYRDTWESSCCKTCQSYNCTESLRKKCKNYVNNLRLRVISQDNKLIDVEIINIDNSTVIGRYYLVLQIKDSKIVPVFMEHTDGEEEENV